MHCREAPIRRREIGLAVAVAALLVVAALLPPTAQDAAYHRFADTRTLLGVPHALDTLSNLAFIVGGIAGLVLLAARRLTLESRVTTLAATITFAGFVLTGLGSAWYHLGPNDAGLAWDRLGMTVCFAGILGLAAAQKAGDRAGLALLAVVLVLGPASVLGWAVTRNVAPYAVMQFGGMGILLGLAVLPSARPGPHWTALIGAYALAKGFEQADTQIFELTGRMVSGHTLKHVAAACASLAVIVPLRRKVHRR